jgi:hypothetical protein
MEPDHPHLVRAFELLMRECGTSPFTTQLASDLGVSKQHLHRLAASGLVRHLARGVWMAAHAPDTVATRIAALKLVVPKGAVVCDEAAGWIHGAQMILPPNAHLEVPEIQVFMNQQHHRLRHGLAASGQRVMPARHIAVIDGLAVTTPLRTACDLGRLRRPDRALAALDSLLRLGDFSRDELLDEIGLFRGYRHVIQLRRLAPLADPRAESPGESALRLRWLSVPGAPPPDLQIEVRREYGASYYLDLGCEELGYAAEFDGEAYHYSTPGQIAHDLRRREECAVLGWDVDVFTKAHTFGPKQDAVETIAAGLARARRRTLG